MGVRVCDSNIFPAISCRQSHSELQNNQHNIPVDQDIQVSVVQSVQGQSSRFSIDRPPPYGQYMAMCIPYIRVLILATGIQHSKPQHWQIFRRGGYRVRVKYSWAFLLEARFTVSVCSGGFLDRHISASLPIHNISKEATYGRVQRARMQ